MGQTPQEGMVSLTTVCHQERPFNRVYLRKHRVTDVRIALQGQNFCLLVLASLVQMFALLKLVLFKLQDGELTRVSGSLGPALEKDLDTIQLLFLQSLALGGVRYALDCFKQ